MKLKISILFVFFLMLCSCNNKSKVEKAVEQMPLDMKVIRFENDFFAATPSTLTTLKTQYPFFFPQEVPDKVWLDKISDPQWRELFTEVEAKYKTFEPQKSEIETLFKHIKVYFPDVVEPKIYTIIGEMDPSAKAIYANDKLIIALELYLGSEHRFYQDFPKYIKQNFQSNQMLPDIVASFGEQIVPAPADKTLLSQLIYFGKQHYLKKILLPDTAEADLIGYTNEQEQWCNENESYMWQYFIEKKLLFSTDPHLQTQFINVAPFSKFYLEIDNESPGKVGQWIGFQIVKSYMENNKSSINQLLKTNSKTIFELSKYKPKKNEH